MNARLAIHHLFPTDHVTDVCCFQAPTGEAAAAMAAEILSGRGNAYGELDLDDTTGEYWHYETIGGSR